MNTPSRRDKIESMLRDDPADEMLRYMLALELEKEGQHDLSLEHLAGLMSGTPPHVPSFVMAGQQLTRLGRTAEARSVFRDGIAEAARQNNAHAAGEMTEFLAGLRE